MSETWWEKVLRLIGFEEVQETEAPEELQEEPVEQAYGGAVSRRRTAYGNNGQRYESSATPQETGRKGALVSLPAAGGRFKRIVVRPQQFREVEYIANHLKERRPVILNLEDTEKEEAQRLVNFLSGAIFALDGEMQRIGSNMLLFTPLNVEVSMEDLREELSSELS